MPDKSLVQEFINELERTAVISDIFKNKLILYAYRISEDAFNRGIKEGMERAKGGVK